MGFGWRNGGKAAVIEPLPRRTVPGSAVSGLGWRNGGKAAVIIGQLSDSVDFISSLLDQALSRIALFASARFAYVGELGVKRLLIVNS